MACHCVKGGKVGQVELAPGLTDAAWEERLRGRIDGQAERSGLAHRDLLQSASQALLGPEFSVTGQ